MSKIFHHTQPYRRYSEWGSYPLMYRVAKPFERVSYVCADCATSDKHANPSAEVTPFPIESEEEVYCQVCDDVIND